MIRRVFVSTLLAWLLAAASAHATPITGGLRFAGALAPVDFLTTTDLDPLTARALCGVPFQCSGVFDALGTVEGTYRRVPTDDPPGPELWAVGGFQFTLQSLVVEARTPFGILLSGRGLVTHPLFDATAARWSFVGTRTGETFAWSSTTSAVPVPDATSTAWLVLSLAGLVVVRRALAA